MLDAVGAASSGSSKKEQAEKPTRRGSSTTVRKSGALARTPSAQMLTMSNDYAQSTNAGDLMIVQPRRQLLGRKKFHKLDPDREDRLNAKIKSKALKAKKKIDVEETRFNVFLKAAVDKGYFAALAPDSEEYEAKYVKLVSKYKDKYKQHQENKDASSSSDSDSDSEEDVPRPMMLKTDLPVVNAFGKGGAELKSALLTTGMQPRYESDTMQEIWSG